MAKYKHKPRMLRVLCNNCYKEQDDYVYCRKCLDEVKDAALREQREGIAGMVNSYFCGDQDGHGGHLSKLILAYGQGKEGEEDTDKTVCSTCGGTNWVSLLCIECRQKIRKGEL
ncbi:MAG: hypothetical protein ACYTEQ_25375 [Planctomycetota bacterium]